MTLTVPWTYGYNGLVLGPGTPYFVDAPEGLMDANLEAEVLKWIQADGASVYAQWQQPKMIVQAGYVIGDDYQDVAVDLNALRSAFAPRGNDAIPFSFLFDGDGERYINAVPSRVFVQPPDMIFRQGKIRWIVQLLAGDPRIYPASGTAIHAVSMTAAGTGGFSFPLTFPLVFLGSGGSGGVVANNAGTAPADVAFSISGPAGPTIALVNATTGQSFIYHGSLGAEDELVIDFRAHTVMLNGASAYGNRDSSSAWWSLAPGDNNILFTSDSGGMATMTWRDTWI